MTSQRHRVVIVFECFQQPGHKAQIHTQLKQNMDSSSSSDSERRSSTSSSLSNDEFAEAMGISNEFGVLPYQYEPENESISSSESNDNSEFEGNLDEETENNRLTNSSWYVRFQFYFRVY